MYEHESTKHCTMDICYTSFQHQMTNQNQLIFMLINHPQIKTLKPLVYIHIKDKKNHSITSEWQQTRFFN